MESQILPPTLHFETADPACQLDIVPNEARPSKVEFILNNAFGFGGINACIALGPPPSV
jgi:3-oxoacyl-(acyl-carrier-protein) synthase